MGEELLERRHVHVPPPRTGRRSVVAERDAGACRPSPAAAPCARSPSSSRRARRGPRGAMAARRGDDSGGAAGADPARQARAGGASSQRWPAITQEVLRLHREGGGDAPPARSRPSPSSSTSASSICASPEPVTHAGTRQRRTEELARERSGVSRIDQRDGRSASTTSLASAGGSRRDRRSSREPIQLARDDRAQPWRQGGELRAPGDAVREEREERCSAATAPCFPPRRLVLSVCDDARGGRRELHRSFRASRHPRPRSSPPRSARARGT